MKQHSTRELFDYWNERRGPRTAPERGEIEPGAIRRVLADTFILSYEPGSGHPFRIAGTRVCALFGHDLKGEAFLDLWSQQCRSDIRDLLAVVAQESIGVVAGAIGVNAADDALGLELLLLPLAYHGRTDARVIGVLAPEEPPCWLGTHALARLKLGTHRYVDPAICPVPHAIVPASQQARIRHGFVVYDGGQS